MYATDTRVAFMFEVDPSMCICDLSDGIQNREVGALRVWQVGPSQFFLHSLVGHSPVVRLHTALSAQ